MKSVVVFNNDIKDKLEKKKLHASTHKSSEGREALKSHVLNQPLLFYRLDIIMIVATVGTSAT